MLSVALALAVLATLWLTVVPGFVFVFGIRAPVDRITGLALGTALSSPLVGLCFFAGIFAGAPAPAAATGILAASIPLAAWAWQRGWRIAPNPSGTELVVLSTAAGVALAWLVVTWTQHPEIRLFGFHNLLHTDTLYQLLRAPLPWPEEPELAARPLRYSWFGFGTLGAAGSLTDRPPTLLFPVVNAALLTAFAALTIRCARDLGVPPLLSGLGALGALFLADVPRDLAEFYPLRGMIHKFLYLDLMPASFALWAGALLLLLRLRERPAPALWVSAWAALAGLGAVYPVALPAVFGLTTVMLASVAVDPRFASRVWGFSGLCALAALSLLISVVWVGGDAVGVPALQLRGAVMADGVQGFPAATAAVALALVLPMVLGAPGLVRAARERELEWIALAAVALGLCGAYGILDVRQVEYKYVMYASLPLGILMVGGLSTLRWPLPVAAAVVAALLVLPPKVVSARETRWRVPPPPIDESRFQLQLRTTHPESAWHRVLREETSADTVLVSPGLGYPVGVFANRSLFVPAVQRGWGVPGYGLNPHANLHHFRGHPASLLRERAELQRAIYGSHPRRFWDALDRVRELGRPVALVLPRRGGPQLEWLRERGEGRRLPAPRSAEQRPIWVFERKEGRSG